MFACNVVGASVGGLRVCCLTRCILCLVSIWFGYCLARVCGCYVYVGNLVSVFVSGVGCGVLILVCGVVRWCWGLLISSWLH